MWKNTKSKYNSRKIEADGETFDSRKEYFRYKELQLLEKAGKIENLRRQVKYRLLPSQYEEADNLMKRVLIERPVTYVADFVYRVPGEKHDTVEDCKGLKTDVYILKRKLMLYFHGIKIKET